MSEGGGTAPTTLPDEAYLNEYSGHSLFAVSISFIVLTTVFLALRFYSTRVVRSISFGLEDVFLVAAYIVNLGMCAIGIVMIKVAGVGYHIEAVEARDPSILVAWAKCIFAFEIAYFATFTFPKMAIVFLYLRIFCWRGTMRVISYVLLGFLAATGLSLVIAACLQCRPLAYWWDPSIPDGTCINVQALLHAQSVPGFVLDVVIIALPMPTISKLKLPLSKKIALGLIFAVASFGMVAAIIRAVNFLTTSAFEDRTWSSVPLTSWSIIETSTYIITLCLASLRPLAVQWIPRRSRDAFYRYCLAASRPFSSTRSKKSGTADEETGPSTARSEQEHAEEPRSSSPPAQEATSTVEKGAEGDSSTRGMNPGGTQIENPIHASRSA